MVVDIPNHSFSFSLSPFFLSLFSLFSLFSRVQLSGRAIPAGGFRDPSRFSISWHTDRQIQRGCGRDTLDTHWILEYPEILKSWKYNKEQRILEDECRW